MVESPWRSFATPAPDREYLALISYLPLRRFRSLFRFQNFVRQIRGQVATTEGLLRYSVRATFRRKWLGTLSAWEHERALMAFVPAGAHRRSLAGMRDRMGPTKFVRWRVRGSEFPLSQEDGLRRLRE